MKYFPTFQAVKSRIRLTDISSYVRISQREIAWSMGVYSVLSCFGDARFRREIRTRRKMGYVQCRGWRRLWTACGRQSDDVAVSGATASPTSRPQLTWKTLCVYHSHSDSRRRPAPAHTVHSPCSYYF